MTAASASHRLLNFVQSALLLGLMAAIAWIAVTAIVGPETGLLMALAMVGGLLFAPALPRRLLLSAYQAQRLTGRDAPGLVAALAELARRAGLQRAPALYRVPSRLPNAFALGNRLIAYLRMVSYPHPAPEGSVTRPECPIIDGLSRKTAGQRDPHRILAKFACSACAHSSSPLLHIMLSKKRHQTATCPIESSSHGDLSKLDERAPAAGR